MINKNATIGSIAARFGIKGYNISIASGCSAGNVAIAAAHKAVADGYAEVMIAGGVDTPISPSIFGLYAASQALSTLNGAPTKAMCPYDKRRAGFILGEGAGSLILESLEHALKRGARIYAEIVASGLTNDAEDSIVFSPNEKEMIVAFKNALKDARIAPSEVDYICSHAHSSVILDKKETKVIKEIFGDHASRLAVSSIKAMVGHSMAGGTAMQSIAACLALQEGILPPTINYEVPDPECDLDYVPNRARKKEIRVAMVDSFGLGGTNVVIIFRKV
jgi:3-oxoacyl-[acyl-carrier-protein] synthase II